MYLSFWLLKDIDIGEEIPYFEIMNDMVANNVEEKSAGQKPKIIAGYLASAMNLEDEISDSIYLEYMDPAKWPPGVDMNVFQEIQKCLTTLIEDTKRHRITLSELIEKYGKDKAAG